MSSGFNGSYADITALGTGGTTAFSTTTDTASITVTAVNDAPRTTALTTLAYTENQTARLIAPTASVADIDTAFLNNGFLRVSFSANGTAADQLSILTDAQVSVAGNIVSVGGVAIGTVSGGTNGTMLAIAFNNASAATPAAVTTLLRHIGYSNTSDDPSTAARTLSIQISDGLATGSVSSTINVTPTSDPPTAENLTQSLTVNEDTASAAFGIVVADIDTGETITATLKVNDPAAGSLSITGGSSYDAGTGIWTITGSVSVVNAALAAVTFIPAPSSNLATTITTHIVDAAGSGPADGTISITITPVNDPPTATAMTQTHAYTEGAASVALDPIVITELDAGDIVTVTLTLGKPSAGALTTTGGGTYTAATGVWMFTGTVAQANAALASVAFAPQEQNDVNTSITVHIRDAAGTDPADGTITLNVTPVEDIATITTADVVSTEAKLPSLALFSIASKVTIVDPDTDDAAAPMKYVAGSGSVTNISGPLPPDETLADLLTFDPDTGMVIYDRSAFRWLADGEHVTYTITFMAKSGDDPAQEKSITVTINGLNDAPVLATPNHATFAATTEDSPPGAARTVGSFRGSVTDGDPSPLTGIAITATVGQGDWQYSTDNGQTWTSFTASDTSSLLLRDTDLLRFAPDQKNGGEASFTYRAWDQTSGNTGGFADTSTNGSAAAFSRQTDVVTLAVTSINDAPVMTADHMTLLSITEDEVNNSGQPVWTFLCMAISDVDAGAVQGIALTGLTSGNGHWEYSLDGGTTWIAAGEVSEGAALLLRRDDWMRFVPDEKNGTQATLTYHAWDRTTDAAGNRIDLTTEGATGGTTAYSQLTDTVSIAVSDVNDAPTVSGPVTLTPSNEDTVRTITLAELLANAGDVDIGDTLSVSDVTLVGNGSRVDNLDGTWTITPMENDDTGVTITYKIVDSHLATIATSATFDITPINDAPVAQDGSANGNEDTTISGTLVASDVDSPVLTFTRETQAAHGTVTVHADGTYEYIPDANYFGPDGFAFRVSDGVLHSIATVNLTVDSVNDPPVVTGPVTLPAVSERAICVITKAQLLANSSDLDGPLSITDLVMTGHGTLIDNGNDTWFFVTQAFDDTSVSFTYKVGDGIAPAIATSATLDITPVNDEPVAQDGSASGTEDTTITGTVTATDVDDPANTLTFALVGANGGAQHGTVTLNATTGAYVYTPAHDFWGMDRFSFKASDGRLQSATASVNIAVDPVNDPPVITTGTPLSVAENQRIVATLGATDVDGPNPVVFFISGGADMAGFFIDTSGNLVFRGFRDYETAAHSYQVEVTALDGLATTAKLLTINLTDVNDNAPHFTSNASAPDIVPENIAAQTVVFTAAATDADGTASGNTIAYALTGDDAALFAIDPVNGKVHFLASPDYEKPQDKNHDNNYQVVIHANDGAHDVTQSLTVTVTNVTDAPIAVHGSASGEQVITGQLAASDADSASLAYAVVTGPSHGSLTVNLDGTFSYAADLGYRGADSFSFKANDGALDSNIATFDLDVTQLRLLGTAGNDSYNAVSGNERIDAGGGIDTISFNFKLTDATITWVGNQVIVNTSSSHTVLAGFEVFQFTDGTVNNNDADPLVDDLFYYAQNHDVWNAHADAEGHYHQFGRSENRDPNAFFDTSLYLALNPDVRASGVDPLVHFHQSGWKEGRQPSATFDTTAYLAANPDVAAAHVDPLAHFLQFGAQEGRQPFAPVTLVAPNGFDYVYYLQHNPDVAAAQVDPFRHYMTVGWQEGRNPNALFDTRGYLATYTDVAAAGINPLDHYNQFGWREGRDPSVSFDTTSYLSHHADVAAAHINPLTHYLASGILEGRSPFGDGVWG